MPEAVTFKNAFKARKLAHSPDEEDPRKPLPQMFTFVTRDQMPDQGRGLELHERVPRALRSDDPAGRMDDVFCLVKETMASTALSQAPLLVYPSKLLPLSQEFLLEANRSTCPLRTFKLDSDRREEIRAIKFALRHDFPQMNRAVAWYEQLLQNPEPSPNFGNIPELSFLRHASARQQNLHAFQFGARAPPVKPYELQVVFHRQHY